MEKSEYLEKAQMLLALKRKQKEIEAKKTEMSSPLKELKSKIQELFGNAEEALNQEEKNLKSQLAEHLASRLLEAHNASINALQRNDTQALLQAMEVVPEVQGISFQNRVDFRVSNEADIPDRFFTRQLDTNLVKKALRDGEVIPGIDKHNVVTVVVKTNNEGGSND